jgi:hypothetical protein
MQSIAYSRHRIPRIREEIELETGQVAYNASCTGVLVSTLVLSPCVHVVGSAVCGHRLYMTAKLYTYIFEFRQVFITSGGVWNGLVEFGIHLLECSFLLS